MKKGTNFICLQPAALMILFLLFLAVPAPASSDTKEGAAAGPPAVASDQYAGSDACKTCHEELLTKSFENTPHFKTTLKDGHGCESCHGPGAEHVAGGGDLTKIIRFKELSRQQASGRCLSCHRNTREQTHFSRSAHASNDVGCLDCHSPHHAREAERLLTRAQPELCYGCHTAAKADFAKPFHHRVDEGFVQCADCHSLHGTGTLRNVRNVASGDAICAKCHADKQGPFVFEHLPVKTEGCTSCHTAHGGTNPRLLRVSQTSLMCLQCHTLPTQSPIGPAHNLSQKYQACTMCHTAVHGSNSSNFLFK
ncbi:MAG TPA: DmsE family decaheme c-type cytochrome [Terriglobales bacterium]|nr:DmsE family decaheme c-type cytochrome [Terriglobales bacterium]